MYNHLLDTFKIVAEEGSFNRAGEKLYITSTAVRKQMNQLESYLGVKLFDRSQSGAALNKAGQILYARTLKFMKESEDIIAEVRAAYASSPNILRVGSSNLYPCYTFMDLWDKISRKVPGWQLKVVFIENDHASLTSLGKDYDFLIGPMDAMPPDSPYAFKQIGTYRFTIAAPRSNPLSLRKEVSFKDMDGQPLTMMEKGSGPVNDAIRQEITEHYPGINIVDVEAGYNIQTFNHCVETGSLLLSLESWDRVHPELKTVKLKEKYELPYGIIYLKESGIMNKYVEQIGNTL